MSRWSHDLTQGELYSTLGWKIHKRQKTPGAMLLYYRQFIPPDDQAQPMAGLPYFPYEPGLVNPLPSPKTTSSSAVFSRLALRANPASSKTRFITLLL